MELIESVTQNFFDAESFYPLLFRFTLNIFFAYIIIDKIYYRLNKRRDFLFTFFIFNILIFFIASVLADVKIRTGFAFGLFAIFSILRYRTEQINIKEMSFLFTSIIIAVLNSLVTIDVALTNILFANIVVVVLTYTLEKMWIKRYTRRMKLTYDSIQYLSEPDRAILFEEIEKRTGIKVKQVEIKNINYLKDSAELIVYY